MHGALEKLTRVFGICAFPNKGCLVGGDFHRRKHKTHTTDGAGAKSKQNALSVRRQSCDPSTQTPHTQSNHNIAESPGNLCTNSCERFSAWRSDTQDRDYAIYIKRTEGFRQTRIFNPPLDQMYCLLFSCAKSNGCELFYGRRACMGSNRITLCFQSTNLKVFPKHTNERIYLIIYISSRFVGRTQTVALTTIHVLHTVPPLSISGTH